MTAFKLTMYLMKSSLIFQTALSFLVNDSNLSHGNINMYSIFVDPAGEWKLGAVEYVHTHETDPVAKIPSLERYDPPEGKAARKKENWLRLVFTFSFSFNVTNSGRLITISCKLQIVNCFLKSDIQKSFGDFGTIYGTIPHFTTPNCTALHCTALLNPQLHYMIHNRATLPLTVLHHIVLQCIAVYFCSLQRNTQPCTCIIWHYRAETSTLASRDIDRRK